MSAVYPVCLNCGKTGLYVGMPMCSSCMSKVSPKRFALGILLMIVIFVLLMATCATLTGGNQ